jgi:hypothetical protein
MSILALTSNTLIGTAAAGNIEYNGQFFGTDSAASRAQMQRITQGTAVASTSGTSIDFTGIPAWCKKITVMFAGVSTNGTSIVQIQLGSGSFTTSGYLCSGTTVSAAVGAALYTAGFGFGNSRAATVVSNGNFVVDNLTSNTWSGFGLLARSEGAVIDYSAGSIALGGVLDRVRITTVNGTDAFDAGSINIMYEG